MIKSEKILPIRFYSDLYEQTRFNSLTDLECATVLNYPANRVPHFQIKRNKSLSMPSLFMLRNICTDRENNYYKVIPDLVSRFKESESQSFFTIGNASGILDDGVNPPSGCLDCIPVFKFDSCLGLTVAEQNNNSFSGGTFAFFQFPCLNINYNLKIVVDTFVLGVGSSFKIEIYDDHTVGSVLYEITSAGIYNIPVTITNGKISVVFTDFQADDIFNITYIQANAVNPFDTGGSSSDVILDHTLIKVRPQTNGNDVFIYCEEETGYNGIITPGEYYYILKAGTEVFISEVFKIQRPHDLESLYCIEWSNSCDLNNIYYDAVKLSCNYKNRIYLDAALFNPKYNTTEVVKENGEGQEIPQFRRWQKNSTLDIVVPEFIADALSAIFLHDTVTLQAPLNKEQLKLSEALNVQHVSCEVNGILQDNLQRVSMNIVLEDVFNQANCCNDAQDFTCNPESYIAVSSCGPGDEYALILNNDANSGLFACGSTQQIEVDKDTIIYKSTTGKYINIEKVAGIWVATRVMPLIESTTNDASYYYINCTVLKHTWVELFYNKNGAGYISLGVFEVDGTGDIQLKAPKSLSIGATDLKFKIENSNLNCDFGNDVKDEI